MCGTHRYGGRRHEWHSFTWQSKPIYVIAQDEKSSVVYGMPRAIYEAGVVDEVVTLSDVAKAITKNVGVK